MEVAVLLSPGVTAFEALGPYGVFRRVPGARVRLVAEAVGRIPTHGSRVALLADAAMDDHPTPDVVVVPGGIGIRRLVEDDHAVAWVAAAHEAVAATSCPTSTRATMPTTFRNESRVHPGVSRMAAAKGTHTSTRVEE